VQIVAADGVAAANAASLIQAPRAGPIKMCKRTPDA